MGQHVQAAPEVGFGTTKVAAASLASSSLLTLLSLSSFPSGCSGFDIQVVTGTVYWDNNGSAATANSRVLSADQTLEYPNSPEILKNLRVFADAAFDIRITLKG